MGQLSLLLDRDPHPIFDVLFVVLPLRLGRDTGMLHRVDRLVNGVEENPDVLDQQHLAGLPPLFGRGRLEELHRRGVSLHIITADTNGTVAAQCAALPVEVLVFDGGAVAREKAALVERLGAAETAAVGNGRNDVEMLRAAGLSLAVMGDEGAFTGALLSAHLACRTMEEALDLLLLPHRLKASLRG